MDDFPAGPASLEPRRPLSVVIPVHNGGGDFECCLRRLRSSTWTDFELIVVDDGSTDGSGEMAARAGAIVTRHETPQGPAAARNRGARLASAPIIFFLDADVAVHAEALGRGLARFAEDPGLTALFGSYDDRPTARGAVSQFRNLLHHFVHQQGRFERDARPAHTFWTGCGMIRRDVFLAFGGFDPRLYPRPAIEDIELGYRLARTGHRILLARDVLATHLKRWSLREMVRTDIFSRGVPWTLLLKRSGTVETDLNVKPAQQVCVALTALFWVMTLAVPWSASAAVAAASASLAIVWLNRDFYRFLAVRRGPAFAAGALPLHLVYYTCCGLSVAIALAQWHLMHQGARPGHAGARRHERVDAAGARSIPQPFLTRVVRRLARWTTRSR